jgi:hypothetical protein
MTIADTAGIRPGVRVAQTISLVLWVYRLLRRCQRCTMVVDHAL